MGLVTHSFKIQKLFLKDFLVQESSMAYLIKNSLNNILYSIINAPEALY